MASAATILCELKAPTNAANVAGMARFGMSMRKRLGVSVERMRRIAAVAFTDHAAALVLWKTGVPEARIVASMIAEPDAMRAADMDAWAAAPDEEFVTFLRIIERAATDERNYVRKAVNWGLRGIGKRNVWLNEAAIETARRLRGVDSRAARWIAADALRELAGDAVQKRLRRRRR